MVGSLASTPDLLRLIDRCPALSSSRPDMSLIVFLAGLASLIHGAVAATNSSCQCASSNGQALLKDTYSEYDRPQIHYSPSSMFMNDPNGLVYANGIYHLYYQYNPFQRVAGYQHWGHATSTDLLHWKNMPIAISPEKEDQGIFSGSAVVDKDNTSGFFNASTPAQERIVAMYTLNTPTSQTQEIAYSLDAGTSFIKYENNPVIDINSTQFRDPKVFWHEPTKKWIVATVQSQQYQFIFYSSPDLKTWTEVSRFGPAGWLGFQYEVPDLVEIPIDGTNQTKWVLFLSINPGAPQGGSFIEYFVGEFNGTHFEPDDYAVATQDFGKDFYAGQTWSNLPADQGVIGLAWANNWQYTADVPVHGEWRTIQSLARKLTLRYTSLNDEKQRLVVTSTPTSLDSLSPKTIYQGSANSSGIAGNSQTLSIPLLGTAAFDFNVTAASSLDDATDATLVIKIYSNDTYGSEYLSIGYADSALWVDRANAHGSWYNPFYTDKISTFVQPLPVDTTSPGLTLRGIIDRSVLELFINDGIQSAVVLFFMTSAPGSISLSVTNGMSAGINVSSLDGVWHCGDCATSCGSTTSIGSNTDEL